MNSPKSTIANNFTRDKLFTVHQLSHQQIDDLTGDRQSNGFPEPKARMMAKLNEFLTLSRLFQSSGIGIIPLKGFLLSQKIYEDATYRITGDIDLFIAIGDVENTIELLSDNGFQPVDYPWPADEKTRQFKRRLLLHYQLFHPGKNLLVELHWKLISYPPVSQKKIDSIIWDNLSNFDFSGIRFTILNRELDLLYLVIHGGLHNWRRLKWLADVHEISIRKLYNQGAFIQLVHQLKAQRMVNLCNALLAEFYPGQAVLPTLGRTSQWMVNLSLQKIYSEIDREYNSPKGLILYFRFVYQAFPGITFKRNFIRYLLLSVQDSGDKRRPLLALIGSLLRPGRYFRTKYLE